jgi:hypothetical protein
LIFAAIVVGNLLGFTLAAHGAPAAASQHVLKSIHATPSDNDVGKAVLKALGALALHQASKPQPCDGIPEILLREISRKGRDELIDSALQDLGATNPVERAAVRNLAILALDGQLPRDRARVLGSLRRTNPDMADAVEMADFLIRLAQAIERAR